MRFVPFVNGLLPIVAFTMSMSSVARAGQVLATPLVEQLSDPAVVCLVTNVGAKPVTVTNVKFINEDGQLIANGPSNCSFPGAIFPALNCYVPASSPHGSFIRCEADVKGSAKSLRMQIISVNTTTLQREISAGQ
jgi:hypothetical protein